MRAQQRSRTRQAIVSAAGRLLEQGQRPSLEAIADAAQVSRATAYRYFPGLDALLGEAAVDVLVPTPDALFEGDVTSDPHERLAMVDRMFDQVCRAREIPLRLMLARHLEQSVTRGADDPPLRQNRRQPLIEEALRPVAGRLGEAGVAKLSRALSMIVGTEAMIALGDVVGLDPAEAEDVRRWTIGALLDAALVEAG